MNGKGKTAALFVLLLGLAAVALLLPEQLCRMQEQSDEIQTMELTYQPYEIRRYDTFAQKLEAFGQVWQQCLENGYELRNFLVEAGEFPDDSTLLSIIDEELQALYENGVLPEAPGAATAILGKEFGEVYAGVPLQEAQQNFYYWLVDAETETGTVSLCIDSEFHKLYACTADQAWDPEQLDRFFVQEEAAFAQGWADYWGVTAADTDEPAETDASSSVGVSGTDNFLNDITLSLASGASLEIRLCYYGYGEMGMLQVGLSEF